MGCQRSQKLAFSDTRTARGAVVLRDVARLAEGVSLARAQAAADLLATQLELAHPQYNEKTRFLLTPLQERVVGDIKPGLLAMLGAVGFVLLAAGTNGKRHALPHSRIRIHQGSPGFRGTVPAIDPVVDPVSRNMRVRARIANPAGILKPGMFARATADLGGRTRAILLPEQVIVPRADGSYVFLAVDGKAELRKVTLGKREPGRVEVVSGVAEGDTVILDGQIKLRPGVPVVTLEQATQMMKKQSGKPPAR